MQNLNRSTNPLVSTSQPVVELQEVSFAYGSIPALSGLNFTIEQNERIALVGPSGSGKSTLLRLLNGSLVPTEGKVIAFGQDLNGFSNRQRQKIQRRIGTMYQQFHMVNNLAVIHNVNAGRLGSWPLLKSLFSLVHPLERQEAAVALDQVGIADKMFELTANLSGGEQQRVALARVLVQDPDLILADEPISNIDPERSREIMNLLSQQKLRGKTLVASLHAVEFAYSHFDRVIGLREGKVLFDAPSGLVSTPMISELYRL